MKHIKFFSIDIDDRIFDRIEIINEDLQISEPRVIDSYRKAEAVVFSLEASREWKIQVI